MNRVDRLLAILSVLESRQLITVDQLAKRFHISTAKVYNDIKALEELQVFVDFRDDSGCLDVRGQLVPTVIFTEEEADALERLKAGPATGNNSRGPVDSALEKIRDALKDQRRAGPYRFTSKNKLIIPASIKPPLFGNEGNQ